MVLISLVKKDLDLLDELELDHLQLRSLMARLYVARDRQRRLDLYGQLRDVLEAHTRAEEKVFYPACEQFVWLKDRALRAREEHHQLNTILAELDTLSQVSPWFDPKVGVLLSHLNEHLEEEERTLFRALKRRLSEEELLELASRLPSPRKEHVEKKAA
jgi:hemerythrin superfamily protein